MKITLKGFGYIKPFVKLDGKLVKIKISKIQESTYEQYEPSTITVEFEEIKK